MEGIGRLLKENSRRRSSLFLKDMGIEQLSSQRLGRVLSGRPKGSLMRCWVGVRWRAVFGNLPMALEI